MMHAVLHDAMLCHTVHAVLHNAMLCHTVHAVMQCCVTRCMLCHTVCHMVMLFVILPLCQKIVNSN